MAPLLILMLLFHVPTRRHFLVFTTVAPPPSAEVVEVSFLMSLAKRTLSLKPDVQNIYFWLQILIPHSCPPFLSPLHAFRQASGSLQTILSVPSSGHFISQIANWNPRDADQRPVFLHSYSPLWPYTAEYQQTYSLVHES